MFLFRQLEIFYSWSKRGVCGAAVCEAVILRFPADVSWTRVVKQCELHAQDGDVTIDLLVGVASAPAWRAVKDTARKYIMTK